MKINLFLFTRNLLIAIILFTSCIPQKKLSYLQEPVADKKTYTLNKPAENKIKPTDELYINVSSFDDPSMSFMNSEANYARSGYSNELSVSLITYVVNNEGNIYLPVIGNVNLKGLTLDEAREKLIKLLSDYLNQPAVEIKFAYKRVTVLGEVNNPGTYLFTKDYINVFEALGLCGDLNIHGSRKEIYIIRETEKQVEKIKLDLRDDDLVFNKLYYIQANDIIYVKPRNSVKWNTISTPLSIVLSAITTTVLVLNYIDNNSK